MGNHSKKQKDEKAERRQQLVDNIMLVPIMGLLGIIPLIVRMVYVKPKDERMHMMFDKVNLDDFYSQYKSVGIIILTVAMIIMMYLFMQRSDLKRDKYSKIYLASGAILLLMTIISTLMSDYKEIAIWGVYDRAEGMVMWVCYVVMMFYTFYCVKGKKSFTWIIGALGFLVIITTIIGVFQYAGYDLLVKTKLGQAIIIPKEYRSLNQGITSDFESHKVLATMYHYDYVGSFGAMIVPLFATLTMMTKEMKKKIIFGGLTLGSLFILFGSTSRAGVVGVILAVGASIVIFWRQLVLAWKKVLLGGLSLVIILVGLNFVSKGSIFSRIPELVDDVGALLKPVDDSFDYRDYIPVREIIEENGDVTFVLQQDKLIIGYEENNLQLLDAEGNAIDFSLESTQNTTADGQVTQVDYYTTVDERYSNIQIMRQYVNVFTKQEPINGILVTINNTGFFYFELDDTGVHGIDSFSGERIQYKEAESLGFRGKEQIGSARGYIWSRVLKMITTKNIIIGNGPDTFAAYFPKNDLLAKWWAYGVTNVIVDKPHNLYLQIGMNQGGIALIAFLVIVVTYFVQCIKLYVFKKIYKDETYAMGIGVMLAMIGYLGAAFFNDSVVSVAPIFWILLGTGMAVNYLKQNEEIVNK